MPNYRMLPPTAVANRTCVANGRTYTASPGNVLDAPDFNSGRPSPQITGVCIALSGQRESDRFGVEGPALIMTLLFRRS